MERDRSLAVRSLSTSAATAAATGRPLGSRSFSMAGFRPRQAASTPLLLRTPQTERLL